MKFSLFLVNQSLGVFDRARPRVSQNDRFPFIDLHVPSRARRTEDGDHAALIISFPDNGIGLDLLLRSVLRTSGGFNFGWALHIRRITHPHPRRRALRFRFSPMELGGTGAASEVSMPGFMLVAGVISGGIVILY